MKKIIAVLAVLVTCVLLCVSTAAVDQPTQVRLTRPCNRFTRRFAHCQTAVKW